MLPKTAPEAKGVFYGLTLSHGKGHFVRAIMESIGFMLKDILEAVSDFGIPVSEIHAMGGGARSDL
ncbi:MAG: xylulokinase, partial [Spirochaetales bacterium]